MKTIYDLIEEMHAFDELPDQVRRTIADCGQIYHAKAGSYLAQNAQPAEHFYILREGMVSIEIYVPQKGPQTLVTLNEGQFVGWSWIFPPYRWTFDIKTIQDVSALAFNGRCLLAKCEKDPQLGYLLMKYFSKVMSERLQATRLQLLDLYAK